MHVSFLQPGGRIQPTNKTLCTFQLNIIISATPNPSRPLLLTELVSYCSIWLGLAIFCCGLSTKSRTARLIFTASRGFQLNIIIPATPSPSKGPWYWLNWVSSCSVWLGLTVTCCDLSTRSRTARLIFTVSCMFCSQLMETRAFFSFTVVPRCRFFVWSFNRVIAATLTLICYSACFCALANRWHNWITKGGQGWPLENSVSYMERHCDIASDTLAPYGRMRKCAGGQARISRELKCYI